jgi:hypothetical protein
MRIFSISLVCWFISSVKGIALQDLLDPSLPKLGLARIKSDQE